MIFTEELTSNKIRLACQYTEEFDSAWYGTFKLSPDRQSTGLSTFSPLTAVQNLIQHLTLIYIRLKYM